MENTYEELINILITEKAKDLAVEATLKRYNDSNKDSLIEILVAGPVYYNENFICKESIINFYDRELENYKAKIREKLIDKFKAIINSIEVEK